MFRRAATRLAVGAATQRAAPRFFQGRFFKPVMKGVAATGGFLTLTTTSMCFFGGNASPKATPPFNYAAVRKDLEDLMEREAACGPMLVRLAWHEAGTWDKNKKDGNPNDASMRFEPECMHAANAGLHHARKLLEPIKAKHPNLSYADLWTLAACVAIEEMGGPKITWRWGRTDAQSHIECPVDGRLPDAAQTQDHVRHVFYRMGFNDKEIVALIGAHTIGECHADRSGYVGPWTHDKLGFDNTFYTELLENDWIVDIRRPKLQFTDSKTRKLMMLPGDVAFLVDPGFRQHVEKYAKNQDAFYKDFALAFQKLLELGVEDKLKAVA